MPKISWNAVLGGSRNAVVDRVRSIVTFSADLISNTLHQGEHALQSFAYMLSSASISIFKYRPFTALIRTRYRVELFDGGGHLKWSDEFTNLVTTSGLNKLIDAAFKTGISSPAWFVGLVDGTQAPSYSANDVASEHSGWGEMTSYSEAARQALVVGDIANGAVDNSDSRAVFTLTADVQIAGCFLADKSVKGQASEGEVLYGVGAFAGGTRAGENGDVLRIACTLEANAE